MVDEVDQEENSLEYQPSDTGPSDVEESQGDVESLAGGLEPGDLLVEKDEELARGNVRIADLEQAVSDRDDEIDSLKQSAADLEDKLSATSDSLAEAVASYKTVIVQANPDVIEELISGDTVESIDESLEKAKSLIGKVRQGLETEISLARVPAGAPERRSPDLSALSPREKIQYAIGGRR